MKITDDLYFQSCQLMFCAVLRCLLQGKRIISFKNRFVSPSHKLVICYKMYMFVIDNITVIKGWLINEFLKDISLDQTGRHFSVVLYLNLVYSKKIVNTMQ